MTAIRKIVFVEERVLAEAGRAAEAAIARVAGIAVIQNPFPFAGQGYVDDLSPLFDVGARLGETLMPDVVRRLARPAVSYGKAAIVGVAGDFEHGGALIRPKLGKPMRAAVGGGEAIISSNVKVAAAGTAIDVPLAHKDDIWSFDHFDTMTVMIPDAPRPDEIAVIMVAADGGRPSPRLGKGRVV
jgi:hypothetical protein